jgi:succinate dehydrogenase / fumarate reductase iron-sulfur subunit
MIRGIHATLYTVLKDVAPDLQSLFERRYRDEPFVDVLPAGAHPDTRNVRGVNRCQIAVHRPLDGDTVVVEPWKAQSFPVIKDLSVDRGAFDRIIAAGGFVSVNTGNAVDANSILIPKDVADEAFAAATCIGCGACVAACKNSSAMLFVSAKVSQLALLPQGQAEREKRVVAMVDQMDNEGFGACTNTGACSAECPKEISLSNIARMNREYLRAKLVGN